MNKRCVATGLLMAVAGVVAGCSSLDLGPEPSDYVGRNPNGAVSLTDPGLNAVTPTLAGGAAQGVFELPPASMPGQGANPQTMPAATEPTTTQPAATTDPAAHAGLGAGPSSQPTPTRTASGRVVVPEQLNVENAILIGLQNNISLRVDRLNVPITRTGEQAAVAQFDPNVNGSISGGPSASSSSSGTSYSRGLNANIGISDYLPTGTTVGAKLASNNEFYSDLSGNTDAGVSVNQKLLRGFGLDVNLASVRSAEVATRISQYKLRGLAEVLVANIEETYWTLCYDQQNVIIVQNALTVAQEQLDSTNATIKVGRVAETERAAAVAQVELEKGFLINAKSTLEKDRITFLQLLTPAGEPFWNRTLTLQTPPFIPTGTLDPVDKHVLVAMRLRPDINETKLEIQQNDLTVVQTKNGLLPEIDFFINLDKTGYSRSFGDSFSNLNGPGYTAVAGFSGNYDLGNDAARAAYRSAILTREQTQQSLDNFIQTVNVDVRTQYIEVERTRQQIDATRTTREADETSLQVEQAKFQAGRSTSLLVAQAEQNLLTAQLAEVSAITDHLKALVELYRLEGSLLLRRGIDAPGGKPVEGPEWH